MKLLLNLLLCILLECYLLIFEAPYLEVKFLLLDLQLSYLVAQDLDLLVLLIDLLLQFGKLFLIIVALFGTGGYLGFQGFILAHVLCTHFLKLILVVLLHPMQSLIVCLALPQLGLLFMNDGVVELPLKGVDLFELFVHPEFLVCLSIQGFGLKLRDACLKLFDVLHCLSKALVFLAERCLVFFLDITQVCVALIPQLLDLLTSFQIEVIVLLLATSELIFKGRYLVIVKLFLADQHILGLGQL